MEFIKATGGSAWCATKLIDTDEVGKKYPLSSVGEGGQGTFLTTLGVPADEIIQIQTAHPLRLVVLSEPFPAMVNANGIFIRNQKAIIGMLTADCIALCIYCSTCGLRCIIHAGWLALITRQVSRALSRLTKLHSCGTENIFCCSGPSICAEHYLQVGVRGTLKKIVWCVSGLKIKKRSSALDLRQTLIDQLQHAHVSPENIQIETCCTYEHSRLHSRRREEQDRVGSNLTIFGVKNTG